MANTRSAIKAVRKNERRRLRNRAIRSKIRTTTKAALSPAERQDGGARPAILEALRVVDKAVTKGVLHRNTAARKKSALARRLLALP